MSQDAGGLPGRFPAAVRIQDGEDIAAFLARTAAANYRPLTDLTGHARTARIWEAPPEKLLAALARLTGVSAARLRQATLAAAFPSADLHHARLGRRWSGQPAQCPDCGVGTTGARLNLIATCSECGALLTDRLDPHPPPPPPQLVAVQAQVMGALAAATRSSQARDRLHRLGQLVSDLEPALWPNWPPLLKGESPEWRDRVVRCSQWALHTDGVVARPPSVTATLVALTWEASANPGSTEHLRDASAQMADRWNPDPGDLPPWRTHTEAARGLLNLLRDLGVRPEHVPSVLRRPEDPLILPPYLQPARIAGALTLTVVAGRAHHRQMSLTDATKLLAATVPAQARRLAETELQGIHSLRRLAPYARLLHHDGLRDLAHARAELRHLTVLPADAARQLPAAGPVDRTLAAAWVWLDATLGRPAGGPHPNLAPTRFSAFAANLDPETRLHLRAWWQHRLAETQDLTQSATAPAAASHTAATGTDPSPRAGGQDAG